MKNGTLDIANPRIIMDFVLYKLSATIYLCSNTIIKILLK